MSALQSDQDSSKEGRFLLAIRDYQNDQSSSIRAAAKAYDVSKSTLMVCLCSHTSHADSAPNCQKLTSIKESTLVEWILSMDKCGMPPYAATVQKMANLLLAEHSKSASIPTTIGRNWVQ